MSFPSSNNTMNDDIEEGEAMEVMESIYVQGMQGNQSKGSFRNVISATIYHHQCCFCTLMRVPTTLPRQ